MALIARERLTKSFLMAQRTGTFIASNCYRPGRPYRPIFSELVADLPERAAQWEQIKAARANGRLCNVYQTSADHRKWTESIRFPREYGTRLPATSLLAHTSGRMLSVSGDVERQHQSSEPVKHGEDEVGIRSS